MLLKMALDSQPDRIFEPISFLKPHRRAGNFSVPPILLQRNPNKFSLFESRDGGG
jgi:hypothetical protein